MTLTIQELKTEHLFSGKWITDGVFELAVDVPEGTTCEATLPDGSTQTLGSGKHLLHGAVCSVNSLE